MFFLPVSVRGTLGNKYLKCNVMFAILRRDDKSADIVDLSDEVSELKSNLHRLKSEVESRSLAYHVHL